jgi:hypothetical protein
LEALEKSAEPAAAPPAEPAPKAARSVPPPADQMVELPPGVNVVDQARAQSAAKDAAAAPKAVAGAVAAAPDRASEPASTQASATPKRRPGGLTITVAVGVLLGLGVAGVFALKGRGGPDPSPPPPTATAVATATATPTASAPMAAAPTASATSSAGTARALELRDRLLEELRGSHNEQAVTTLGELAQADPNVLDTVEARVALTDLLNRTGALQPATRDRVFELAGRELATIGPDVLYEIMTTRGGSESATRAERQLGDAAVRERATPALRIAYELRVGPDCPAKLALLERAQREGDRRSQLELLRVRECQGGSLCCLRDDRRLTDVIAAISGRLGIAVPGSAVAATSPSAAASASPTAAPTGEPTATAAPGTATAQPAPTATPKAPPPAVPTSSPEPIYE